MPAPDPSQCEWIDRLAEEFVQRYRRGERPSLKEYLDKYPDLADDIRTLFPTLIEMEQVKEGQGVSVPATLETASLGQIGDYRLVREVGRGGMGVVYEAEQVSLGRRVALKVLPPHLSSDRQTAERFRREARSAAKLHHTNIVPVFEVGRDGDTCYYVMQFIQGQSLDQILVELRHLRGCAPKRAQAGSVNGGAPGETPVPPSAVAYASGSSACPDAFRPAVDQLAHSLLTGRFHVDSASASSEEVQVHVDPPEALAVASSPPGAAASPLAEETSSAVLPGQTDLSSVQTDRPHYFQSVARIGWQVANALAYAHARGIIHRDVKPSNLLLDTAGVVWITDFGLAKTQEAALTTTGDVVGTLRYMAPERLKGEGDERSDVYALGLTLYELLVLRPAFTARDRLQLIDRIKNEEPSRPRALDHRIPRDLETIVLKAIHKDPKQRYQTAEEMAEDLRRFLADEPIKAKRTSQLARLRLWSRRHPALAALLLVLLLAAAGATTTAFYLRTTLLESEANRQRAEEAERDGKYKLWLSYLSQAQARRMSRQSGQRFASLRALQEALALPTPPGHSRDELRTEAIAALCLPDLELAWEGTAKPLGASGLAIDPAFQRYAWADKDGNTHVCRLNDEQELLQLPGGGRVDEYRGLQFSPNGRFLDQICYTPRGLRSRLWDLELPQPKAVLDDDHNGLAFRPDSREVAVSYRSGTVVFLDLESHRERRRFILDITPMDRGLYWNPKLPQLLVVINRSTLRLLNVDTGQSAEVGPKIPGGISNVAWHPEGRLLAVGGEMDRKLYLWDVPSARLVMPPLEDHKNRGVAARFNHAGDRLLSTDWSSSGHLWDVRSGQLLLTLPGIHYSIFSFASDDRLVGTKRIGGKIQLYNFWRGEELRILAARGRSLGYSNRSTPLDAEGRVLAVCTDAGVALVDVARGEETVRLPLPGNVPLCFDSKGALWTHGAHGLLRWPVAADAKTGRRRYGPPQWFFGSTNGDGHGSSPDARIVAIPQYHAGTAVFYRDRQRLLRLSPQEDVRNCAVSPDGRWIVTGSHSLREGAGAKVWEAKEGHHVKDLPVGGLCSLRFSPDGKWLLTLSDEGPRLWAVESWEEGPKLGGTHLNAWGAFTHDSKLLALGDRPGLVRLVAAASGAEIARLTAPEPIRLQPCCFTPDDTRLIAVGLETTSLYIFDLRAIRRGLAELGLDWDASPLPAATPSVEAISLAAAPLAIELDLADVQKWPQADQLQQQAHQHLRKKELTKALAALRQAVKTAPGFAPGHNNLAWLLATGPKELRDPQQALTEARKAVELCPDQAMYLNTLGVALYYTGRFADAIPILERSLREQGGQAEAFDLFFLAMCYHRLGEAAKAQDYLERGKQWFRKHKETLPAGWGEEMTTFQAEAESVLHDRFTSLPPVKQPDASRGPSADNKPLHSTQKP
jgi:serine/threonine protein kinase/WD40 repeat protein/Tfp pilus assembly protein PilF